MATTSSGELTALLEKWRAGSTTADAELMNRVHRELRRLAGACLRHERRDHTLEPTALVNEAYLRLVGQRRVEWANRAHFFGIAAAMMRRVLVDHARRRRAGKRFAGNERVTLSGIPDPQGDRNVDVLDLDAALSELATLDARQAHIVELRYFTGASVDDIAAAVGVSPATVKRDLVTAKLWLRRRLSARN